MAVTFSPDGKTLASGSNSLAIPPTPANAILWDVATGKQRGSVNQRGNCRVNRILFSADGKMMATASGGIEGQVMTYRLEPK